MSYISFNQSIAEKSIEENSSRAQILLVFVHYRVACRAWPKRSILSPRKSQGTLESSTAHSMYQVIDDIVHFENIARRIFELPGDLQSLNNT